MIPILVAVMSSGIAPIEHRATVPTANGEVAALYRAEVRLETRELGGASPRQPSRRICSWTAVVDLMRSLPDASAVRRLGEDRSLRGSRSGSCQAARHVIAVEVARQESRIRDRLMAQVTADRPVLAAELGGARPRG